MKEHDRILIKTKQNYIKLQLLYLKLITFLIILFYYASNVKHTHSVMI